MLKLTPWIALGWILGTFLQFQQEEIWQAKTILLSSIVCLALFLCAWALPTSSQSSYFQSQLTYPVVKGLSLCCLLTASTILALSVINARCLLQDHRQLVRDIEGQDILVTGMVASLPMQNTHGVRFKFEVHVARHAHTHAALQLPAWVELNWYDREGGGMGDAMAWGDLHPGDTWQFVVRFKAAHGLRNPGGFDEELWLWAQGVMATGTVRSGKSDAAPQKLSASWSFPMAQARQFIRSQIALSLAPVDLPARNHAGVIAALVMGDQGAIQAADWDLFRATGVAHLMSISGLHITLWAWLFAKLIGHVWRWTALTGSSLCLRWPAPLVSAWGGVSLATLYALFAGWGLPAQRTVLMLWVIVIVQSLGLRWPRIWVWALAFWVLIIWDPWALLQAGFWLSFIAVGALMLGSPLHFSLRTKMRTGDPELVQENDLKPLRLNMGSSIWRGFLSLAKEQWVVMLALTPLSILFFGQVSWIGLLANFIAIPWVTWVVTPLAMLGMLYSPFWPLALWLLQPLMLLLELMGKLPGSVWNMPVPPVAIAAVAVGGGLLLLQAWPWAIRCWGILFLLPAFLWQEPRPPHGQFDLWFADVGQGNAVILRTANHALLYDAGPAYSENSDAGQKVLVPLMSRMGVQLDRLVLSHRDLDHTGGAKAVLGAHQNAQVWSSLEAGHPLTKIRPVQACLAGQKWQWDGVQFEFLHPTQTDYEAKSSSNALSCVLRIDARQGAAQPNGLQQLDLKMASALLVGDIEAPQEMSLLQRSVLQSVGVLLVPHHGSQTSSTESFIGALMPQWAVVQAAYRSRYGHPAPKVVERYESMGVKLVASPACGAAYWQSIEPEKLQCERELRKRYWDYQSH